jgi:hypothetical protein
MSRAALVISLIALFVALAGLFRREASLGVPAVVTTGEEDLEVAVHMGRMQRYHQKLWASARAGNAELAAFYLHELEEAMEAIADADIEEDGIRLTPHMNSYGLGMVEAMERTLASEGVEALLATLPVLVNGCNGCHSVTGHGFIVIQEPTAPNFHDQDFAPRR